MEKRAGKSLFLDALGGGRPARRPIWIMRQAGRYLPEYQELRRRHTFVQICKTPELACEATLQPVRRFGFDAAIIFNDILLPLEPAGARFVFTERGPRLPGPIRGRRGVEGIREFDPREDLAYVSEAIRLAKAELDGTPLIGFAAAPLTLAAYLVEGGPSEDYPNVRGMVAGQPELFRILLEKLAELTADYVEMQAESGADAVQLFESCAEALWPQAYAGLGLPFARRIFRRLSAAGVPSIFFLKGDERYLPALRESGACAVSLHWSVDMASAVRALDGKRVQGNLNPRVLFEDARVIREQAEAVCRAAEGASGHVFNLGHGILPDTPVGAVETLVGAVREYEPACR